MKNMNCPSEQANNAGRGTSGWMQVQQSPEPFFSEGSMDGGGGAEFI